MYSSQKHQCAFVSHLCKKLEDQHLPNHAITLLMWFELYVNLKFHSNSIRERFLNIIYVIFK